MDRTGKLETLETLYNMFKQDCALIEADLAKCKQKAEETFNLAQEHLNGECINTGLLTYDYATTKISNLTEFVRRCHIVFELFRHRINNAPQNLAITLTPVPSTPDPAERQVAVVTETHFEKYTYPHPIYCKFKIGYEGECIITYVLNAKQRLFYINETGNTDYTDSVSDMQMYFSDNKVSYDYSPREGEIFAIDLENYIFRAVRQNYADPQQFEYNVFLIDVGEELLVTGNMKLYPLPEKYQTMPSQAILCKLEAIKYAGNMALSKYLKKNLYVKHSFVVLKQTEKCLELELIKETNPFKTESVISDSSCEDSQVETDSQQMISNPFKSYLRLKNPKDANSLKFTKSVVSHSILNGHSIKTESNISKEIKFLKDEPSENNTDETFEQDASSSSHDEVIKRYPINRVFPRPPKNVSPPTKVVFPRPPKNVSPPTKVEMENQATKLTADELDMLYDEPLGTTNAMKAVMGHDPQDDKRICRFYDHSTKGCFKGRNCRFEHVPKIKDGWTRDTSETTINIPVVEAMPNNGSIIRIIPSHIVTTENFFAQLEQPNPNSSSLRELNYKMNSAEYVLKYKKMNRAPARLELVIAFYVDGLWYRARVLDLVDEDSVKVFYVDYGNSDIVLISNLRLWDKQFAYLPFQAIGCRIYGIKEIHTRAAEAQEYLCNRVINRTWNAEIMDNIHMLTVRLFNDHGLDIGEELIECGFAETSQSVYPHYTAIIPA